METQNKENCVQLIIKHNDGRVMRLFRCECGTPVYKKDLTNGTYEFMTRQDRGMDRVVVVEAGNKCKISCPNPKCELSHIVLDIRERMYVTENVELSVI